MDSEGRTNDDDNDGNTPNASEDQSVSSWLEDFRRDDTTTVYSYTSPWLSNYTMSNLCCTISNLLSSLGSALERRLEKLAYRAGIGNYAEAEKFYVEI